LEVVEGGAEVYSSFSPRLLMEVGGQHHASTALTPGKHPGTHATEGWVGPRAGVGVLQKRKKSLDFAINARTCLYIKFEMHG